MKTILILEDNDERIAAFRKAIANLGRGFEVKVWRDARAMIAECEAFFPTAALISLGHDLKPILGSTADPGTGMDVATFLADFMPICPVLIHSSNTNAVYSMDSEFRFAQWIVNLVVPAGTDWVETLWLPNAKRLLAEHANTWNAKLPADHAARVERMKLSLDGLGVGLEGGPHPAGKEIYQWL